ncbi:MAG: hypothetical protein GEU89_21425, partial [Kiloniellaceae bacterium]|nr:hypothetical protein [Kiloniellaceae bacterium]
MSVGAAAVRQDGRAKIRGEAAYVTDLELPGLLFAAILRSPLPHARIERLDLAAEVSGPDGLGGHRVRRRAGPDEPAEIEHIDVRAHLGHQGHVVL